MDKIEINYYIIFWSVKLAVMNIVVEKFKNNYDIN